MFLKSLNLKGFKSFADNTTLEFEPGITVVVGPNGSGKSNVVDAVAWVLGAQGPRTVRSNKMEDVIFAGTANKAALGRAEVSLTIDNSAGALPIDFTEVTLTRILWRSGESEYAINGVPCRLLDIQELLSDSGVGRTQHVIVSQGQLDAVLNARPEDRRSIIEEAAGVLKYRRRREKAQRRLESTEGNLLRLQDLLREVRRQLRPLERQADAARRHGSLVEELRAIRLHLAGREVAGLRNRIEGGARAKADMVRLDTELRATLARLDTGVLAAEAEMSAQGGIDLGDDLTRYESLRERARGLSNLIAERRRGLARELASSVDEGVIASLESESARLAAELAEVQAEAEQIVPRFAELTEAEARLAADRAAFEHEFEDGFGDLGVAASGQAAEVRGELSALRAATDRGRAELDRVQSRLAALEQKIERLAGEATRLRGEIEQADTAEQPLVASLDEAEKARAVAEVEVADAEAALRASQADQHAWTARAEALALALDAARARAGAERLSGVAGVVGTLLEMVEIDEGWEAAFEAAAGEAIAAVVVDGVDSARAALLSLRDGGHTGAVLALDAISVPGSLDLNAASIGADPVRSHVRSSTPGVDGLLDNLLANAVCVEGDWAAALDIVLAHPAVIAVTRDGDRFAASGWRTGAGSAGATGAALDEARRRAESVAVEVADAEARLTAARDALRIARSAEADLSRQLDGNDSRLTAAGDGLQRVETDKRDAETEAGALREHAAELSDRLGREEDRVAELEQMLPALEAEEAAGVARVQARRAAQSRLDERAAAVRTLRTDLEVRAAGLDERRTFLTRRRDEVDARLAHNVDAREAASGNRQRLESLASTTDRLGLLVDERLATVETGLAQARERRRRQSEQVRAASERLDGLRRERAAAEKQLSELREKSQRAEIDETEVRLRLETAVETVRREFDCEPELAMAAECPELPAGTTAHHRVRELERELRIMGAINPLALEEFTALQERSQFLEAQLEDVKSGRRDLAKVIRAIDAEIQEVFAAAYADVADNFVKLFGTLFPGGTGRLRLTDPDNLLETGIEVEARPSGKNVKKLSLLSGGERSLTALAFLFAVFRSRPSPFYLMDEVEAALDDVNLHRFLDLIHEFRDEAQLVIVSHQKRTMEAADILYGVTMQPGGSSRVISEKVSTGA